MELFSWVNWRIQSQGSHLGENEQGLCEYSFIEDDTETPWDHPVGPEAEGIQFLVFDPVGAHDENDEFHDVTVKCFNPNWQTTLPSNPCVGDTEPDYDHATKIVSLINSKSYGLAPKASVISLKGCKPDLNNPGQCAGSSPTYSFSPHCIVGWTELDDR